jgi:acyl-CoA thioesterase II
MSASFQIQEPGFEHQDTAPHVTGPEGIESELEMARRMADKIPEKARDRILCEKPIEMRQEKNPQG